MRKVFNQTNKIALALMIIAISVDGYSRRVMNSNKGGGTGNGPTPAAGCAAAVDIATLELNNVRTRVEGTGGSMWQDRANSIADYEVPKRGSNDDPKFTSIYAGALWMGGQDINGQLKLAAVTFRASGNDFWPGPLDKTTAEVNANECALFDRNWGISRAQVDQFVAWYETGLIDPNQQQEDFPGYTIPKVILEWPAKGNTVTNGAFSYTIKEDLAPFFDRDGDDFYDPYAGDYPKYDLVGDIDCRTTRDVRLFGDTTIWFVFNDKGNTHSETQGPAIGMEIRGQAFAFATNDEVNNMTFYNYEMINRSTFTLTETYFGQWVDADLGGSTDDFVGCDAQRGLGYCYNGDQNDEGGNGITGYGAVPPAIGVDFFEGPYADNDGIDNPLTTNVNLALANGGIPYKGLGIGYGDGIVDNERYGMRKFVYYSIGGGQFNGDGDPQNALDYYNYLRGRWRQGGANMVWGGNGNAASSGGTVLADLLFPGDSDPLFWSTKGISASPANWTETSVPNQPGDRRFLESAGPFTLEPGAVNDLTVGVVWARAVSGDNESSIEVMRLADDKAQALFDNCFKLANGPDAPDITFQELDNEIILYLTNRKISNNYNETYSELNPFIAIPDTLDGVYQGTDDDKDTLKIYEFEGYLIYQLKNGQITANELDDPNKARLAAQVDIKNGVTQLVNYTFDQNLQANVPKEMVNGADNGIRHSFRFTEDLFAREASQLVNHKTYYYMAIAYGYNEYKEYDPLDPLKLDGQTEPYIGSRRMAGGAGLRSFAAIPHDPAPENGGTIANSDYGDQPQITRIEGQGNGGNWLDLTQASEDAIVANNFIDFPVYEAGFGPIDVKVVDPLNVKAGKYRVQFQDSTGGSLDDAFWVLHTPGGESINSDQLINVENEQIFLDEGIAITIKQVAGPGAEPDLGNGALGSDLVYADSTKRWLGGFTDGEGQSDRNWIRSGNSDFDDAQPSAYNDNNAPSFVDPESNYEGYIGATWAPYALVSVVGDNLIATEPIMQDAVGYRGTLNGAAVTSNIFSTTPSVDIVFTSDKSKWTRCPVVESRNDVVLAENSAQHLELRESPGVDKNGNPDGSPNGYGWFPGYAIDLETGVRLNMAFAEDSWLAGENGRDMIWNPTSTEVAGINNELMMGGKHYVYVFKVTTSGNPQMPAYDQGAVLHNALANGNVSNKFQAWRACCWAGIPMLEPGRSLLETQAKVKLRVEKPYASYATASTVNNGLPMYEFDMTGMQVDTGNGMAMDSTLAMINVVPNPYYAYSEYETGQLDNRIKITNLPEVCTISIYNVNGTLMRRFNKGDAKTSLDWDLKNHVNVPVASGVYLIHVDVPNIGERTLKWYGMMKPTDLNGF